MAQGLVHFPGIRQVFRGELTLSHGISPSVALLEIAPQESFPSLIGTLAFTFDGVQFQFPDCRVDKNSFSADGSGHVWRLAIFDRRWKWRFGEISGRYNLRDEQNNIQLGTEKAPRKLCELCLEAMKEKGFDVSAVPNDARPEIEWDHENPAEALAQLADSLGCRIVLGTDNKVKVVKVGRGRDLPAGPTLASDSLTIDPPEAPDSVKVIGEPNRYQARWKLRAVGMDTDGTIKPINDLSYKPAGGWVNADVQYFDVIDGTETTVNGKKINKRKLATEWVWRAYQIHKMADDSLKIPGLDGEPIKSIEQVLPLEDSLIETYDAIDAQTSKALNRQVKRQRPARISGVFYDAAGSGENTSAGAQYEHEFSIDAERGIVHFGSPMLKISDSQPAEAEIQLECAFSVRDNKTDTWRRYEQEKRLTRGRQNSTGPELHWHNDLIATYITKYDGDGKPAGVTDNQAEVKKKAQPYLDAAVASHQRPASRERAWNGLMNLSPDGAIQQVTWQVGVDSGAMTRASLNDEFVLAIPTHEERRQLEQLRGARLAKQKQEQKETARKRANQKRGA